MTHDTIHPALLKRTDEVELRPRTVRCLTAENILYIGELIQMTEMELLRTPNIGDTTLHDIKTMLAGFKLHLGMEVPGWPPENIARR